MGEYKKLKIVDDKIILEKTDTSEISKEQTLGKLNTMRENYIEDIAATQRELDRIEAEIVEVEKIT